MADSTFVALPDRALLALKGPEAADFLDALVSNKVTGLEPGQGVYAALLTPQGKFLHDFFVIRDPHMDGLRIDVATDRLPDLKRRLTMYRLRAKVGIEAIDNWSCYAVLGKEAPSLPPGTVAFPDPRLAAMGWRIWSPNDVAPPRPLTDYSAYERHRLALGVPEGARDIEVEKGLLLENHFEALHGVDFKKGCYIGQELTARTKYRGLVKKQLHRVRTAGASVPPPGTPIVLDGGDAGTMLSGLGNEGLALLRLDAVAQAESDGKKLEAAGVALVAERPDYAGPAPEKQA